MVIVAPCKDYEKNLLGSLLVSQCPDTQKQHDWRCVVSEACVSCGSDAPPNLCSRCRQVAYCSTVCQRLHWPVHKQSCRKDHDIADDRSFDNSRISKLSPMAYLHTVWGLWDTVPLPETCRQTRSAAARLLPSARISIWDRAGVESLLSSPSLTSDWREVWHALPRGVCQADIARYLIALHVGGVYLDADAELLEAPPAGSWSVLLLVEQRVPDVRYLGPRESPHLIRMAQFMFATIPQHDFWRSVLELSLIRCRQLLSEGHDWLDSDVLWATGPDVVTTVFHEHFSGDQSIQVQRAQDLVRHRCDGAWRKGADRRN